MTLWNILELNTDAQCVLLFRHRFLHFMLSVIPNLTHHPQHWTQPAESASCQIAFHFKAFRWRRGSAKEWRWPGWNVLWDWCQIPAAETTAVIHLTIEDVGEKWTNKSEQPRINIPWCLLSKLLTQVAFSLSVRALFTSGLRFRRA